jgi:hypothetical protein
VANFTNVNAATNISTLTANAQSLSVSSIAGNVANFTNVNAATNVSTATLFTSTINGLPFPSAILPVKSESTIPIVAGVNNFTFSFSGVASGFYILVVTIQSGSGNDPFTCSTVIQNSGSASAGGSIHMPSLSGAAPSFSNYVIIQDGGIASNLISVIVNTNDGGTIGQIAQISAYRIT